MTVISGWGRSTPVTSNLVAPRNIDDLIAAVTARQHLIARGLGRSYGDAAQLAGGTTLDMTRLAAPWEFNPANGVLRVGAGRSLASIQQEVLPLGWFLPVIPGTAHVTAGGALASDIHGKGHHRDSSFASHVLGATLIDGSGNVHNLDPSTPQFWATVGGMGLTGIIVDVTIALRQIPSTQMWAADVRCRDLDSLMQTLATTGNDHHYSVAWIDTIAKGKRLGRGIVSLGDHATVDQVSDAHSEPIDLESTKLSVPDLVPNGLLNQISIRAFNEAWFRRSHRRPRFGLQSIAEFFHPLDMVNNWNRIYGPRGFVQYQFVVPDSGAQIIEQAINELQRIGAASFLSVLKRFGPGNRGHLSFPISGWTLALDIPAARPGLAAALDELDVLVAEAGGRVYLTKDSRLVPAIVKTMYPRRDEWREVRAQLDPDEIFQSDLSRRLNLTGSTS